MNKLLLLLIGGGIGTVARYVVTNIFYKFEFVFPIGTLIVNTSGSFLIGLIWGICEQQNISESMRTFIFVGILGGYTTFSKLTLDSITLFRMNEAKLAVLNILANNVIGILMVILGFFLSKWIMSYIN